MTPNSKKSRGSKAQKTSSSLQPTASAEDVFETPRNSPDPRTSAAAPVTPKSPKKRRRKLSAALKGLSFIELIERIYAKEVTAKMLDEKTLLDVVRYLVGKNVSNTEMSELLDRSVRMIERDRHAIREQNALPDDPGLRNRLAGQVWTDADAAVQRLARIACDKKVDARVRVEADVRAFGIRVDAVKTIQNMGCFNTSSSQVTPGVPDIQELEAESGRLARIGPVDEADEADAAELEALIARTKAAEKLAQIKRNAANRGGARDAA